MDGRVRQMLAGCDTTRCATVRSRHWPVYLGECRGGRLDPSFVGGVDLEVVPAKGDHWRGTCQENEEYFCVAWPYLLHLMYRSVLKQKKKRLSAFNKKNLFFSRRKDRPIFANTGRLQKKLIPHTLGPSPICPK